MSKTHCILYSRLDGGVIIRHGAVQLEESDIYNFTIIHRLDGWPEPQVRWMYERGPSQGVAYIQESEPVAQTVRVNRADLEKAVDAYAEAARESVRAHYDRAPQNVLCDRSFVEDSTRSSLVAILNLLYS